MRKLFLIIALMGATVALAGYVFSGRGFDVTATTTVQRVALDSGDWTSTASVINNGSETIYVMRNVTTNDFALTNAVAVYPGFPYTFPDATGINSKLRTQSICYATTNATSDGHIAFQ